MGEERLRVGGVPARLVDPGGSHGLLLLGHGGGHSKDAERFVRLSQRYAGETGLAVVCIDAVDHGERRSAAATDALPRGWHSRTSPKMVADRHRVVDELSSIGPPVAYVGFSMGALFGFATVGSMPTIVAAVFVVGGLPNGRWTDDPDLGPELMAAARGLGHAHVLMLNKDDDELFEVQDVGSLYESVTARSKRLTFFPGGHDEWGPDLIADSVTFLIQHARPGAT